jgi:hypothetical protein
MLDNITPVPELLRELARHQSFLDVTVSEQPEEVVERGNELAVIISRSGKMKADADYHRDTMMQSEIMSLLKDTAKSSLPASTINKLLDAACKDANYLATACDRLNRTATHQLEWCRSLVSKAKAELAASYGVSGKMPEQRPLRDYRDDDHIF